ncbi:MAG: Mur ligase family protein [Bacteroidaceae bacterium]
MKNIEDIKSVYFIGIGGIGMSAIARYFLAIGKQVAGYDRIASPLTNHLTAEGAIIHYVDDVKLIPAFCSAKDTLIVFTPAIPKDHKEWNFFLTKGYEILKRAAVLGIITRATKGLCVAGTHGKTSTSTMLAHLMYQSHLGCTAFLGGVAKNYDSNLLLSPESPFSVIEADEFDRSFHQLTPWMSIVTAADPDHLDIYGNIDNYRESFKHYMSLIQPGGVLVINEAIDIDCPLQKGVKKYTYGRHQGDFHATNERIGNGQIIFDLVGPDFKISDIELGVPISINIDNSVAAISIAYLNGVTPKEIKIAMRSFEGVERRFDFRIKNDKHIYISDYAHHPAEIEKSIASVRELYPDKKLTVFFQPHLYTRTRDFYKEFAAKLSDADEVYLLPIYPAREMPISGIESQMIDKLLPNSIIHQVINRNDISNILLQNDIEVVLQLGAGDIEDESAKIKSVIESKEK